jgi:hypothetical protein
MRLAIVVLAVLLGGLGAASERATAAPARAQASGPSEITDISAQARIRAARPRTRIRVVPLYPYRTFSTTYPVPYTYEYPGPGAVRQCASWLATQYRPSGPVIVPQMRCWWER